MSISRVCSVLERGQLGLQPTGKPLGSFLFLGPTGVGKTELTLEFSRYLFGEGSVFRFDMSEFLHLDNVKLFMGDETGSPGRLGRVLSEYRQGILLFDEIEKAHRLIWDLFLQMLDAARITLADHRAYDLSGFYIVCTSNIGSQQLLRPTRLPFTTLERAVVSELHRFFRPELIGRFDEKIVFKPLSPDTQRQIGRLAISEELDRLRQQGFDLCVSDLAFEFLVRRGIHKALGARPMKKTVQKFIGDAIRQALKFGASPSGTLAVSPLADHLTIELSRPNVGASFRKHAKTLDKSPHTGGSLPAQTVYAESVNTKQNVVGPSIRALRMRRGWSQASLSARLKLAGWNCSRSRLAKIECGLITVRDHDLPYFLNIFDTSIEKLYPAEVLTMKAAPFQNLPRDRKRTAALALTRLIRADGPTDNSPRRH